MKIRSGFVSNSSSSSFIINKGILSAKQVWQINNHISTDDEEFNSECGAPVSSEYRDLNFRWNIAETKNEIKGSVSMDNFDMELFLEKIGVKTENIEWTS